MNKVSALGDITGDDLKKLEAQALELGKKTQFSAKASRRRHGRARRCRFNTTQIMAAMPGVLDLAAAAQVDVARASEIAVSTMGAFQLSADQAGRVADVLASASARGVLSIDDLAEAMKYVAPVSQATGRSLEETAAAISPFERRHKGQPGGDRAPHGYDSFREAHETGAGGDRSAQSFCSPTAKGISSRSSISSTSSPRRMRISPMLRSSPASRRRRRGWRWFSKARRRSICLTKAIENDKGAADRMATTPARIEGRMGTDDRLDRDGVDCARQDIRARSAPRNESARGAREQSDRSLSSVWTNGSCIPGSGRRRRRASRY